MDKKWHESNVATLCCMGGNCRVGGGDGGRGASFQETRLYKRFASPLEYPMALFPRLFPFRRPDERHDGPLASDALPLPIWLTNTIAFFCFTLSCYYLLPRWGEKNNNNVPLHFLNLREILAIVSLLGSFIYMIGFFGIPLASWDSDDEQDMREDMNGYEAPRPGLQLDSKPLTAYSDEEIALAVKNGEVASHSLESALGDPNRAVYVRRKAVELSAGSLQGLPVEGLDYSTVLGQCCEMVVGYVQIPVGVAGPLILDGFNYMIPMATTEGCLVASTNRGCKAISQSAGATTVLLKDGMTRAPVVKFPDVKGAAKLKYFIKDRRNFQIISSIFKGDSRFAKLQSVSCTLAGRNVYMRFRCFTGDAMGMNMISKGVQNVLSHLKDLFPDMDIISVSGNYCADKKATAVNWIEGRGKSVVCEAIIKEEIVEKVLKTSVAALLELNTTKNLVGSALAGAIGGFNAHAANIVSAIFIATGQDPAQNVESSQCITLMEIAKNGRDLHASVTMPCIEVGTIGGGTQLASQAACLNLLGVKGPNLSSPGSNAQMLARIVAGGVLAGELSLMAALAAGQLVKSHMKYNRSKQDLNKQHVSDS